MTYAKSANGHSIVLLEAHVGPVQQELACFRKPRSRHRGGMMTRHRHERPRFDGRNQVVYEIAEDGDGGRYSVKRKTLGHGNDAGDEATTGTGVTEVGRLRKGRPKGSKNKHSVSNMFNYRCEKKSFAYESTTSVRCKACDQTFDGDPIIHCLEHHETACPVCGDTFPVPLATHIKSHGIRPPTLTVSCYECYECGEKYGNSETMATHVLDEHVIGGHCDGSTKESLSIATSVHCTLCGWTVRSPDSGGGKRASLVDDDGGLRKHVSTTHANVDSFPTRCCGCDQPQTDHAGLVEHLLNAHVTRVDVSASETCDIECVHCHVKFDDRTVFVEHLVTTHCPRKTFQHPGAYRCRVCFAGFKSQINVLRHACNKIKSPRCVRCDKTFPSKMRYSFHLQFHEQPGCPSMHLHCDICLAEFENENQLYDHIRFRHELHDKAVCEICGRTFKSSMGLNIHRRYHNGSRDFTCKSCDKSFLNKSTLKEHEISHMDVKPFQCHICGQYLSRASRLRSHVKTHRAAESTAQVCYCCVHCGFVAPNMDLLTDHLNKEHDYDNPANEDRPDGGHRNKEELEEEKQRLDGDRKCMIELSSVVKCEFCDSTYIDAPSLNSHRDATHTNRDDSEAFICVVCTSTFSTYSRLTTHKLTHGINMESSLADSEPSSGTVPHCKTRFDIPQYFSCQYCAKRCLHYTYFCLHRRLKHPLGVQTHTCDRCFLDFKTSWRLTYHKKTVHGQPLSGKTLAEKYECTVCFRKFVKIGALNLHKTRSHIDINSDVCKYLCHMCGKFFSSECSLRNHSKIHEDSGGAVERQQNDIVTNQPRKRRRRTYGKPAVVTAAVEPAVTKNLCPYCNETIEDKAAFIEHVNRHIQCKPAVVPQTTTDFRAETVTTTTATCNNSSSSSSNINNIILLTDPAVFCCDLCDQSFADSTHLDQHLAEHVASDDVFLCVPCCTPFFSVTAYDIHRSTCAPNVRFVGSSERTPDHGPTQSTLIIECSEIFNGKTEPSLSRQVSPARTGTRDGDASSTIDRALESSLLDEILGIVSTPPQPQPPAFDHIDAQSMDTLEDIFDSLQLYD